jgi:hypothetical protein
VLHVQTGHCFPNLSTVGQTAPNFPRLAQPARLTLGAANTAITATNISLTATLNPQMRFQALQTGSWSCSAPPPNSFGGNIHCTRASLGANKTESITATITAPVVAGQTTYTLTVSSSLPDTNATDNTRSFSFDAYAQSSNGSPVDPLAYL